MANVRPYINHLLQNSGITPACSEEERLAAEDLAQIFRRHGFEPEMQEFSASGSQKVVTAVLGIAVFLGALLMGIGGIVGVVGLLLALAGGVFYTLERMGKTSLSSLGGAGLSQNVIAYHKASGPLASPRNRPVVVVAHYDSPRADLLSQMPYASYRPAIVKLLPYAMLAPAVIAIVRLLPLPGAAKVILWIVAILAALVPLVNAVATILNRFVLPYTSGSVCNKSSVAAMLGVMNAVAPFRGEREFPGDMPFERYMRGQRRATEAAARAAAEQAAAAAAAKAAKRGVPVEDAEAAAGAAEAEAAEMLAADAAAETAEAVEAAAEVAGAEAADATLEAESDDLGGTAAYSADALAAAGADAANAGSTMAMSAEELAAAAAAGVAASAEVVATASAEAAEPGDESAAYDETEAEVEEVAEADEGIVEADAEEAGDASDSGDFGDAFFTSELTGSEAAAAEVEPAATEGPEPAHVNAEGNYRYGADAICALGMLPESCVLEYDEPEPPAPAEPAAPAAEPVAAELVVEADETMEPEVAGDDADYDGYAEDEAYDDYAEDDYDGAYAEDDAYDKGAYDEAYDEDAYEGYDESGYAYQPSDYGSTGLSRLTGRGGIAEKLSGFGASASRFFGSVLDRGKSAIQNIEEAAHGVADRLSGSDEALDELAEDEAALDAAAGAEVAAASAAAHEDAEAVDAADDAAAEVVDEPTMAYEALSDEDLEGTVSVEIAASEAADGTAVAAAEDIAVAGDGETGIFAPLEADDAEAAAVAEAEELAVELPADVTPADGEPAGEVLDAEADEVVTDGAPAGEPAPAPAAEPAPTPAAPLGTTVAFTPQQASAAAAPSGANSAASAPAPAPAPRPVETVDSLMAQINPPRQSAAPRPAAAPRRTPIVVPDPGQPSLNQPVSVSRTSLFDLPDPSAPQVDPFAPQSATGSLPSMPAQSAAPQAAAPAPARSRNFTVLDPAAPAAPSAPAADPQPAQASESAFEVISAQTPVAHPQEEKRRGLGGLFRRKKKEEPSMGEYLGLGDDFDAKSSGRDIGAWDNFEDDDDWKGGATGVPGVSEDELRDAVTSLGDDELLGHDIWFVATGASEYGNAGIKAFLATHRDKLRGVFLINLECVGAGQLAMLSTEGERRVLKGDKRIMNLVRKVSGAFHHEFGAIDMPYLSTDAYAAMNMSLRSLTIAGVDGPCLACSHSEDDLPLSLDVNNINEVADVVTEVIRRS